MASKPTAVQETYKKLSLLGEGSFGKAFLVRCGSDNVSLSLIHLSSVCV